MSGGFVGSGARSGRALARLAGRDTARVAIGFFIIGPG